MQQGNRRTRSKPKSTEKPEQVAKQPAKAVKSTKPVKPPAKQEKPVKPEKAVKPPKIVKPHQRMIFAQEASYSLAAVTEGNRLTDFWIEEEQMVDRGTTGNIYRGIVTKVLHSLNAAFVNIGLEKDGFLSLPDVVPSEKARQRKPKGRPGIGDLLQQGEEILVQMAKEPIGDKGPSLTQKISIPGRFLVYMPHTDAIRMSRMLDDKEKKRFRQLVSEKFSLEGGLIFRTASVGRDLSEIQFDYEYLMRVWRRILRDFKETTGPKLLHEELDLFERVLRDEFHQNIDEIVIDHPRLKYRLTGFLKVIAPTVQADSIIKFNPSKDKSVWCFCNMEKDIEQLFSNYVYLESGSYIIIEEMETLVAIDVNTGKNIAGKNQDETILRTNMEAAKEIVRQLRLRQIGGIIIVDFIDMRSHRDQDKVYQLLEEEIANDRTPADVQQFTDLGLIQITRQRSGKSLTKRLTYMCPHCHGSGRRPSIALP